MDNKLPDSHAGIDHLLARILNGFQSKGFQSMQPTNNTNSNMNNMNMVVNVGSIPIAARNQRPWIVRALYFVLIGFWFSAIWLVLAWLLAITIIGLPAAQWMFLRVNAILTLQRLQ